MSSTSGKYFIRPESKPYPTDVFTWEDTDVLITNTITMAQVNQIIFMYNANFPPTNNEAYQKLHNYFSEQKPSLLSIWKESGSRDGHAVLATSMTVIDPLVHIRVYDSNWEFDPEFHTGDVCYTFNPNLNFFSTGILNFYLQEYDFDRFDAFTGLVFNVNTNFISLEILTQKLLEYLRNNARKLFSSSCPVNLMIKDSQGLRYGFDENGIFIDEIPGCSFLKVPADTISTDSVTVIYAPDGENYEAEINSYNQGSMLYSMSQVQGNNQLLSYYADSVIVTPTTVVKYDENNPQDNLQVDYNGDGQVDTSIVLITVDNFCSEDSIQADWNMISLPYLPELTLKTDLFPTATSDAYWFNGGYIVRDTLEARKGYWLKFPYTFTSVSCGQWVEDTIHIKTGWNMVGGFNEDVPTVNIDTEPPGILGSNFYGYAGGYDVADTIKMGKGYWIKSDNEGIINLNQSLSKTLENKTTIDPKWASITISDNSSREMKLYFANDVNSEYYQLPPLPPIGAFDIRFEAGTMVEDINKGDKIIIISGASYPITIKVKGTELQIKDVINGSL